MRAMQLGCHVEAAKERSGALWAIGSAGYLRELCEEIVILASDGTSQLRLEP